MKTFHVMAAVSVLGILPSVSFGLVSTNVIFGANFGGFRDTDDDVPISPTNIYSSETGYGFEPGAKLERKNGVAIGSSEPFYFSVKLPEGNYEVTVSLGDKTGESTTTVKAELRRL